MRVLPSASRGRKTPKWSGLCVRNHHILFFFSFSPPLYLLKIYWMKNCSERIWKRKRAGSRLNSWRTHWDAPAKPELLLFLAQVSFLQPFGVEPKAEQHGEHTGTSTGVTSYLDPFTSWPVAVREGLACEMMSSSLCSNSLTSKLTLTDCTGRNIWPS